MTNPKGRLFRLYRSQALCYTIVHVQINGIGGSGNNGILVFYDCIFGSSQVLDLKIYERCDLVE